MEGIQQITPPLAWICIKVLAPNFYQGWFIHKSKRIQGLGNSTKSFYQYSIGLTFQILLAEELQILM